MSKTQLTKLTKENEMLKLELYRYSFVNSILTKLVEKTQKIKIGNLIKTKKGVIDVYNLPNIEIRLHENNGDSGDKKKGTPEKRERFIKISSLKLEETKKSPERTSPSPENKIKNLRKNISSLFEELKSSKNVKKAEEIRKMREKIMVNLDIKDYIDMIKDHYETIKKVFGEKKSKVNIHSFFSPIEHRLAFLPEYTNIELDSEEVVKFVSYLSTPRVEDLMAFSKQVLYNKCATYGLALTSIEEIINKNVFTSGVNNLIYLPLQRSKREDPYSFYRLTKIEKNGEKHWEIDIRLYETSRELSESLIEYCISLYRKIYYDVFEDNKYRSDFDECSKIGGECMQLFSNIIVLANRTKFLKLFQASTIAHSTYNDTDKDKVRSSADDKLTKRKIENYTNEKAKTDILEKLCRLFDDPDRERISRKIKQLEQLGVL